MVGALEEVLKEIYGEAKIEALGNILNFKVETTHFVAYLSKPSIFDPFKVYLVDVKGSHTVSEQDFEILKMIGYFIELADLKELEKLVNLKGGDK